MEEPEQHRLFMREAIREASLSDVSETWPNPRVGAIIVEQGLVVSRGRFRKDGGPHAEREALANIAGNECNAVCDHGTLFNPWKDRGVHRCDCRGWNQKRCGRNAGSDSFTPRCGVGGTA